MKERLSVTEIRALNQITGVIAPLRLEEIPAYLRPPKDTVAQDDVAKEEVPQAS